VGDSQAMIIHSDFSKPPTVPLDKDIHRPHLMETERDRIKRAGGFVTNNRVDGELAVSRAFGDSRFKRDISRKLHEQKVVAIPAVAEYITLQPGDILLLACDGLFDVLSPAMIDTFVRGTLISVLVKQKKEEATSRTGSTSSGGLWNMSETLSDVAGKLIDEAILRGSRDNMTVMMIHALPGNHRDNCWSEKFSKKYLPPIIFENAPPSFTLMVKDELKFLSLDEDLTLSQCIRVSTGSFDPRGIPVGLTRAQMSSLLSQAISQQWAYKESWVFLGDFEIPDARFVPAARRRFSLSAEKGVGRRDYNAWNNFVEWLKRKISCSSPRGEDAEVEKIKVTRNRLASSVGSLRASDDVQHAGESVGTLFAISSLNSSAAAEPEVEFTSRQTSVDDESLVVN